MKRKKSILKFFTDIYTIINGMSNPTLLNIKTKTKPSDKEKFSNKLEIIRHGDPSLVEISIKKDDLGEFFMLLLSDGYHDHHEIFQDKDIKYILEKFFGIKTY